MIMDNFDIEVLFKKNQWLALVELKLWLHHVELNCAFSSSFDMVKLRDKWRKKIDLSMW